MQEVLHLPRTYQLSDAGNGFLPWFEEKLYYPKKYAKKKLKRQFTATKKHVCLIPKIRKVTPQEKLRIKNIKLYQRNLKKKFYDKKYKSLLRKAFPWKQALKSAKDRAKKFNLPFDLTYEYLESIYTGKCAVTQLPFVFQSGKNNIYSCSLDRIKPELGYVKGNVRFTIWGFNLLKYTATDKEVLEIATAVLCNISKLSL